MQPIPAAVGDLITVQVIAEHDPSIAPFTVRLRVRRVVSDDRSGTRWGRRSRPSSTPGESEAFERLVNYYSGERRGATRQHDLYQ